VGGEGDKKKRKKSKKKKKKGGGKDLGKVGLSNSWEKLGS